MDLAQRLTEKFSSFSSAPYLFVGSGMSRRYIGLPDWGGLLEHFCKPLQQDFSFYRSDANGSYPGAASMMGADFHKVWHSSSEFHESRIAYSSSLAKRSSPLKHEISKHLIYLQKSALHSTVSDNEHSLLKEETELLKCVTVDGIITTNWDTYLENLFPSAKCFIGQDELLLGCSMGIEEIYKIHGCVTQPESLVLDKDDYDTFERKNPYLAAKLTTVFIEHPVIFLGYSFSDSNVQGIIQSLLDCLGSDGVNRIKDRLFFVSWKKDHPNRIESTALKAGEVIIPVTHIELDSFTPIYTALSSIKRALPARILRQLKSQVYELVLHNDPEEKLHVVQLEDDTDPSQVEIVYGVGISERLAKVGVVGLRRQDLFNDLLYDNGKFESEQIIVQALPNIAKGSSYVPIFKYLRDSGRILDDGTIYTSGMHETVIDAIRERYSKEDAFDISSYSEKRPSIQEKYSSLRDLLQGESEIRHIYLIALLKHENISPDELGDYLRQNFDVLKARGETFVSFGRKLACLYDYIKYGPRVGQLVNMIDAAPGDVIYETY